MRKFRFVVVFPISLFLLIGFFYILRTSDQVTYLQEDIASEDIDITEPNQLVEPIDHIHKVDPIEKTEPMGVSIESLAPGDGVNFPKKGDKVTIHYHGTLSDGNKFDSSIERGSPFVTTIGVGQVIKGWDEGIPQLSLGQKARLTISPDYGYGPRGYPPVIPPNSTLIVSIKG